MSALATLDIPSHHVEQTLPKKKGTLLVVDDEGRTRQSLRVIFKDDFEVLMAERCAPRPSPGSESKVDVAVLISEWPACPALRFSNG